MGSTRDEAVQLFNDATLTAEAAAKVDKLQSLKELILNKDIQLLQVFLPELVVLQADSASAVRKFLPEFLEACPPAALQVSSLLLVLQCLQGLLQDSVPAVIKAAVMASSSLFRTALAVVAGQGQSQQGAQAVTSLWQNASTLRNNICSFAGNHKVPGVRLNATKFMEQVVLTFTAENVPVLSPGATHMRQQLTQSLHGILTPATLMREADTHLGQLVNMLRAPGVATLPGAVAIVAVKAAGSIAQQRPFFMNKILPVLIALGSAQEAGPSTGGVQKSVKTGVANALLAMLKCTAAEAAPWRRKIVDALKSLGAGTQAEAEMRRIERQGKRAREPEIAPAAPPFKQAKLEPTSGPSQQIKQEPTAGPTAATAVVIGGGVGIKPESAAVRPEGAAATPLQAGGPGDQKRYQQLQQHAAQHQQQQQQPAKPLRQALGTVHIPDATPESELSQVLAILGALAAESDKSTLVAVLQGLSPQVLADCVIANMAHLPAADTIAGTGSSSGLAGLMQGLQQQQDAAKAQQAAQAGPRQPTDPRSQDPRLRPQQPHQQPGPQAAPVHPQHLDPQPALQPQGAPGEPVPAPPPGNPGDVEMKPQLEELKSEPGGLRAGTPPQVKQETKVPIPVIPKAPPQVRPANLTSQQQLSLRRGAINRILANGNTPSQETRIALLSRLATKSPAGDGIGDEILQHMFRDYHTNHGHELALTWLFALYKEHSTQIVSARSTASGLSDNKSGPAACRAVKAESAAEPAIGMAVSDRGGGASGALVKRSESGAEAGPSGMEVDGLEGVEAKEAAASTDSEQQQGRASNRPAGQSGQLAGTPYESVLLALLEGLRENLPANDKAIAQILLEVPALPGPGVGQFLAEVAGMGGEWATLALSSARDIIINRPPNRSEALQVVLDAASGDQADTRNKAVRLIANKLFAQPQLQDSIEKFARCMLFCLTTTSPSAAATADDPALSTVKAEQPQLQNPQATAATPTEPSSEPQAASQQQLQHQSEEEGTRLSGLYCALCTKKQPLLRDLLSVYGRAADGCKEAIEAVAAGLARSIGPHAAALVDLVQDTPPDSQRLLLQMLHVLTEQGPLSGQLTQACVAKFESSKDALFLVPAIPGMQRAQVLQVFPRLLELGLGQFKAALHRLLMPLPSSGQAMMTAAEVFISLHSVDATKDGVPLRKVMACLDPCMKEDMRSTFPPEAMAVALQQLVTRNPLPPLFMRFTIQTLNAAPRLKAFVLDILSSLVNKQVWTQGQQWKGWIMCSKQLVPDSFPALLQLPTQQFGAALAEMSSGVKLQLSQYAKAPSCPVAVPRTTLVLLQEVESAVAASSLNPAQADIGSSPVVNNSARTPSVDRESQA
ncbi:TPA: hypothetical protein ACH3X2_007965 [Trebouxia sp. C0005]